MILSKLFYPFRKIKEKVIEEEKRRALLAGQDEISSIKQDFDRQIDSLKKKQEVVKQEEAELEALIKRNEDRKYDLKKANEELQTNIRLTQAKGTNDQLWLNAFSQGFSKAWDMMMPYMTEGVEQVERKVHDMAYERAIENLEPAIEDRLERLEKTHLKHANDIISKRKFFEERSKLSHTIPDKEKYQHYVEALGWALNGNGKQTDE